MQISSSFQSICRETSEKICENEIYVYFIIFAGYSVAVRKVLLSLENPNAKILW